MSREYGRNSSSRIARAIRLLRFRAVRSVSTIGGGGDTTIPSPGRSPKQPLPGIGLHDPLYGRQACPKCSSFLQRVGQISPREGLFSCRPLSKREHICDIPAPPPQSLNDSKVNGERRHPPSDPLMPQGLHVMAAVERSKHLSGHIRQGVYNEEISLPHFGGPLTQPNIL